MAVWIGARSAHVRVLVPLTAMMGGPGGPTADLPDANAPATLEGYGPITASIARALAGGVPPRPSTSTPAAAATTCC